MPLQEQLTAELAKIDLEEDQEKVADGERKHEVEQATSLDDMLLKP